MSTAAILTRFLVENLVPDHFSAITPAYIDACEVFDNSPELWDLWDILHWSTQNEICSEVNQILDCTSF